jgi:hypothetical protein
LLDTFVNAEIDMNSSKASILLMLALIWPCVTGAQTLSDREPERLVFRSDERPDLAVDYSQAARFKLATRKHTYRIGETIIVGAAVLNTTGRPVFFWNWFPEFFFYDERGEVMNPTLALVHNAVLPGMFELVEPNHIKTYSSEFVIGCPEKNAGQSNGMTDWDDERSVFENDLFVSGNCLRIIRPGTYTIRASQQNGHVVESPNEPEARTAVGTIEAEPLKIKVIE